MKLRFVSLGAPGERYPAEVRALAGLSGVYVLRVGGRVVYVGESHTGRLYQTITRHAQSWGRVKGYWARAGFTPNDPGVSYARESLSVAWRVLSPSAALRAQAALIRELRPRDNVQLQREPGDDDDDVDVDERRRRRRRRPAFGLPPVPF